MQLNINISDSPDICVWDLTSTGSFSFSSAWNLIRQHNVHSRVAELCWHKRMPTKISGFMWRLIKNEIPTDWAVQRRGVNLASKCHCCIQYPSYECNTHLFLTSEVANSVWSFFAYLTGIQGHMLTINHLISTRGAASRGQSLAAWLRRLLPGIILWELWISRNDARYDTSTMLSYDVISKVRTSISDLYYGFKLKLHKGDITEDCITFFNLSTRDPQHLLKLILWRKPTHPWIKLNTDGASKGNPGHSDIGGIFRNNFDFIFAFSKYCGINTSFYAETLAIY